MAWSKETLARFLPVLAAGNAQIETGSQVQETLIRAAVEKVSKIRHKPRNTLGSPDPDRIDRLPAMTGKVTPIFNALRPFIR